MIKRAGNFVALSKLIIVALSINFPHDEHGWLLGARFALNFCLKFADDLFTNLCGYGSIKDSLHCLENVLPGEKFWRAHAITKNAKKMSFPRLEKNSLIR